MHIFIHAYVYTIRVVHTQQNRNAINIFGVCALIIDAPSQHIVLGDKVVSELTSHLCIINRSEI